MLCALYARVACAAPNNRSCECQIAMLRKYAEHRGWSIFAEYVDRGESGMSASRPQLDKLMTAAGERRFDSVLCLTLDRLDRSGANYIERLQQLHRSGISLFFAVVD